MEYAIVLPMLVGGAAPIEFVSDLEMRLSAEIFHERSEEGVPVAWPNVLLAQAARERLNQILGEGELRHGSYEVVLETGYKGGAHEILAKGYDTAKEVVAAWLASEGHATHLLDPKVMDLGVAVSRNPWDGLLYFVVLLGLGGS